MTLELALPITEKDMKPWHASNLEQVQMRADASSIDFLINALQRWRDNGGIIQIGQMWPDVQEETDFS